MIDEIHYLLGNDCNLKCEFCFWEKKFPNQPISFKRQIIDKIADSRIKKVTLSGGEPLCASSFVKVVEYLHSRGLKVILHTNGLKINKELAQKIMPHVVRVSLALDGSNRNMTYKMRKNRKIFNQTIFLIKLFNKLGVPTNVKTLITKVNKDDLVNIGFLLSRLPIKYWSLLEFNPIGRGKIFKNKFYLSNKEYRQLVGDIRRKFPQINIRRCEYSLRDKQYCFITADGKVYTYVQARGDILIGDLIKGDDLKQIIKKLS